MKVIFMGTPVYAQKILEELLESSDIEVVAVYTQPDKPVGRKKLLTPSAVKTIAVEKNIPLYQPTRLRDEESIAACIQIECDYIVVAAYGQILPQAILSHAPCINLHASILPKYRGASPIQEALLRGDKTTGVTAMKMDIGLDTGDIIKISEVEIDDDELVEDLFEKLTIVATDLTLDVLRNYENYTPVKQDEVSSSHCRKITKADGELQLLDAVEVYNKFRAFHEWPGIYLQSGLKLKSVTLNKPCAGNDAGKILEIRDDYIVLGCELGSIKVYRVQPESKKEMDIAAYLNGKRLKVADYLS